MRLRNWIAWVGMIVAFVLFASADTFAATQEKDGKRVTTSSWIRYAIRKFPILGFLIVAEVIWHFWVQAYYPDLPL